MEDASSPPGSYMGSVSESLCLVRLEFPALHSKGVLKMTVGVDLGVEQTEVC